MKTAVSLPDALFESAERLAKRLKKSRSELYQAALAEYLQRHDADAITDAMNRVVSDVGEEDPTFRHAAASRLLKKVEW